jgi:hypothetical protein
MKFSRAVSLIGQIVLAGIAGIGGIAGLTQPSRQSCTKVELKGEINAGQAWRAELGQGWIFRMLPIPPGQAGYSGWDLAVDQDPAAGYPDALLLATLPYNSINEREIATTFGLRAQDAIGWNPRSFHFLIDPGEFRQAQQLYLQLAKAGELSGSAGQNGAQNIDRLLRLQKNTAAGEFHIEDVRLNPGIGDPAPFAQAWTLAALHMPHEIVAAPDGRSTEHGVLVWIRFSVTLWLPGPWKLPAGLRGTTAPCVH